MRRVAYLSTEELEGFFVYDELTYAPLRERGVEVETVPWRARDVDWSRYEAVVIRSTWDYQSEPGAFLDALEDIDRAGVPLYNPLDVVRWNLDKSYLADLSARGIEVVPTQFAVALDRDALGAAFDRFGVEEIVAKPALSANADDTFRLRRNDDAALTEAAIVLGGRTSLVQPFLPGIAEEGEFSLFYFDGGYSHAILKSPAEGDFRVQEEHGGRLVAIEADEELRARGAAAMAAIEAPTLYARVDFVRHEGVFLLMELELIEPSLYFQLDAAAPARFADALVAWLDRA